jgi:hypothetical protein
MSGIAVVGSSQGSFELHNFDDVTIFKLTVKEEGFYVVLARVVLHNRDSDAQAATVRLTHNDGAFIIDKTDFRMPNDSSYTVYLQGTLRVDQGTPRVVDFRCQTFKGLASQFSLFAVQVDALRFD